MKVLLKVGHSQYLLPDDSGLQTVIKALSRAIPVYDYTYRRDDPHLEIDPEPQEVSVKYIPNKTPIRKRGAAEPDPYAEPLALIAPTSIIPPPPKS